MNAFIQTLMTRRGELWTALLQHLQLSLLALLIATIIAVPLAIWVQPHKKIANVLLQLTGILQTIPSLALLGLLIPFVGIGNLPAIIALVVYALLPIFQNTYVGLDEIDPSYEEAATAFGLSRLQKLVRVELPLAMPVIISGIRTATVLIIGTATLAALIGAGGLGTFILLGIDRNDPALTLLGALAAALLAILFSFGLQLLQKVRWRYSVMALGAILLGFGGVATYQAVVKPQEEVVIAGKLGSEPDILINMYKELITAKSPNTEVTLKPNFGQTSFLFNALKSNQIDIYPEFTGTVLESLTKPTKAQLKQAATGDSYQIANDLLKKQQLTMLPPMQYNNTYAVVVTQKFAKQYQLKTISDLNKVTGQLHAGFDLEFIDRRDGYRGIKDVYGLQFQVKSLDASLRYQALTKGTVNITDGYTTDSQLRQYHLLALQDDRKLFPTYRGAPLMSQKFAKAHPTIVAQLKKLTNQITEKQMQEMNYEVNVLKEKPSTVAKKYLTQQGLLK